MLNKAKQYVARGYDWTIRKPHELGVKLVSTNRMDHALGEFQKRGQNLITGNELTVVVEALGKSPAEARTAIQASKTTLGAQAAEDRASAIKYRQAAMDADQNAQVKEKRANVLAKILTRLP